MAQDALIIPPIQQSLEDVNSASANGIAQPLTAKPWYLYFDQLGRMVNRQGQMVSAGTHAARPPADVMPDGAIYVETDRGAIYQKISGFWVYLAGTMWDTVNPDHRPTDLGPQDANFDYRGTDIAREFIWTGYKWVETTVVRYGSHADRLALTLANVIDGELFIEWDRPYVMYQNQGGTWHYVGGTMFGTLSPDQRPTDLGTNDAGFDFRGTDQQREFIWSQTAWVEVTPVGGASTLTTVGSIPKVTAPGVLGPSVMTEAGGNIGIGTANPQAPLHVAGQSGGWSIWVDPANNGGAAAPGLVLGEVSGVAAIQTFGTTGNSLALNPTAGAVGIGMSNPTHLLELAADSAAKPATNTWTITSDIRTKRNVRRFEGGMGIIRRLEPIVAEYNGKGSTPSGGRVVSLDPVQLREVVPHAVSSTRMKLNADDEEETDVLGVNTHEIIYHLLLAIKQIDLTVQQLADRIA